MAKWLKFYAMSLHYLVKSGCSKFLPNTGFVIFIFIRHNGGTVQYKKYLNYNKLN